MTAHDPQRRAALVAALVEIVAERGLDAVSVREVAAHAQVSVGAVQHHFPSKSAMLKAAMEEVGRRWVARLERDIPRDDGREALRFLAKHLVPAGPADTEARIWLAFVARAAVDDELAALHRTSFAELERVLVTVAVSGMKDADAATRRGVADDMASVLSLVDGLAVAVLLEPERMPAKRANAIVDRYLDRMFAGR